MDQKVTNKKEITFPNERMELLYEPCHSKEELRQHIITFLDIDLPDYTVDEDSTSNPLELVWSIYETMLTDKGAHRVVAACSRNSMKTLSASIIRFYGMVHFRRSGTHLAATLEQSDSAVMYLDKFLEIEGVKEYLTVSNSRRKILNRLPANSFTQNSNCMLRVAVATKKGVNSQRGSLNTKDETGLLPKEIISESAYIADPTRDEHRFNPIEINLSSRKAPDDMMEDLITEATGADAPKDLRLHKWSMVDFIQKCPTTAHRPEEPRKEAYLHTDTLKVFWNKEEYEAKVSVAERGQYKNIHAYAGCETCPIFITCQSRAVKQKGKSLTLRSIDFTDIILKSVKDVDSLISQALNWRPGKSGQVFKMFRDYRHLKKPREAWLWLFGTPYNPEGLSAAELEKRIAERPWTVTPSKDEIFEQLVESDWTIHYGTDWGFSPAFATCPIVAYHRKQGRAVLFHMSADQGMPNSSWADWIAENLWKKWPGDMMCPDMEDPASTLYFGKHFIPCLTKKPPRIHTGVAQLRSLLFDPRIQSERLVILDDGSEAIKKTIEAFNKWSHLKTALGFNFEKFDDNNFCDFIDPIRYALDPFLGEMTLQMDVKVELDPEDKETLYHESKKGNEEARVLLEKHMEPAKQLDELFRQQTGYQGAFQKQVDPHIGDKPSGGRSGKKSTIKFSF